METNVLFIVDLQKLKLCDVYIKLCFNGWNNNNFPYFRLLATGVTTAAR